MSPPDDIERGLPGGSQDSSDYRQGQLKVPQIPAANDPDRHPPHDGLYEHILRDRQGSKARPRYEFYTTSDIVRGTPSIPAFHARYPNTRKYRAFGYLNEILLHRFQRQLTCILGELHKLSLEEVCDIENQTGNRSNTKPAGSAFFDEEKFIWRCLHSSDQASLIEVPSDGNNANDTEERKRTRRDAMTENLSSNAERIFSLYRAQLHWVYELRKFPRPSYKTHEDHFRQIQGLGGLGPADVDYLRASDDFIYADADPLYERFHSLLIFLRDVLEIIPYITRLLPAGYTPFRNRTYSARRIRLLVKCLIILSISPLILVPLGVLHLVPLSRPASFAVVAVFAHLFALLLILLRNTMNRVFLGVAAYLAVFVNFLAQPR